MSIFKLSAANEQHVLNNAMEDKKFTIVKLPNNKENNTMTTKLNFAQRYFIWENNFLFGRIPGLRVIATTSNKAVVAHPKYCMLALFVRIMHIIGVVAHQIDKHEAAKLRAMPVVTVTDNKVVVTEDDPESLTRALRQQQ